MDASLQAARQRAHCEPGTAYQKRPVFMQQLRRQEGGAARALELILAGAGLATSWASPAKPTSRHRCVRTSTSMPRCGRFRRISLIGDTACR